MKAKPMKLVSVQRWVEPSSSWCLLQTSLSLWKSAYAPPLQPALSTCTTQRNKLGDKSRKFYILFDTLQAHSWPEAYCGKPISQMAVNSTAGLAFLQLKSWLSHNFRGGALAKAQAPLQYWDPNARTTCSLRKPATPW